MKERLSERGVIRQRVRTREFIRERARARGRQAGRGRRRFRASSQATVFPHWQRLVQLFAQHLRRTASETSHEGLAARLFKPATMVTEGLRATVQMTYLQKDKTYNACRFSALGDQFLSLIHI